MKLLYYDTKDALSRKIGQEEIQEILDKQIKIVPKIKVDNEIRNYLVINFDNFMNNETNPEFRDNFIYFDIICHLDQWLLTDFQLRPYKIAGELDYMFNNKRLTGIGKLEFVSSQQITVDQNFIMVSLVYRTVHGEEDKIGIEDPKKEEQFLQDFNNIYNN